MRIERHIAVAGENAAAGLLAETTGLPGQTVKQAMQKGAVWLTRKGHTQRLRRASKVLCAGDELHIYFDDQILAETPTAPQLVADESAYSIWYKPYGLRSQGSKWGDHCTINRWVEQHLQPQRPAFIVHRLDRAATGLMVIAHQKRIATALAKQFESRAIDKRYRAIVHGRVPIAEPPITVDADIDGRPARSHITGLRYDAARDYSLVEVAIETGRKHQIRRHLSDLGFPVVGDRLYGPGDDREDLQLTAVYLAFECPLTRQPKTYRLPDEWIPTL